MVSLRLTLDHTLAAAAPGLRLVWQEPRVLEEWPIYNALMSSLGREFVMILLGDTPRDPLIPERPVPSGETAPPTPPPRPRHDSFAAFADGVLEYWIAIKLLGLARGTEAWRRTLRGRHILDPAQQPPPPEVLRVLGAEIDAAWERESGAVIGALGSFVSLMGFAAGYEALTAPRDSAARRLLRPFTALGDR